jgi:hypothetical protein
MTLHTKIKPFVPVASQYFDDFEQWVNRASQWLTCHAEYNDTQYGENGHRGYHFTAMCFDQKGRRLRNGGDFQRARDEDAFPVWWIWPDQVHDLIRPSSSPTDEVRS